MKNFTLKAITVLALVAAGFSPALAGQTQAYYNGGITFSNTSPTLSVGQTLSINIYTTGQYLNDFYISQNSNPSVVNANISGSVLNLYANTYGTSNILVCQSSSNQCGTLYVNVNNNGGGNNGIITFSNPNPTVQQSQSIVVSIYSSNSFYANQFYVSQNSNSYVVTPSINNNSLSLYGNVPGSSTITICQNNNYGAAQCGTLYVTVTSNNGGGNGTITFSNSNPNLYLSQSLAISIYSSNNNYNNSYYISQNTNNNVVTASVSASTLSLYANSMGNSTITVCQTGLSACGSVYVTVSNSGGSGSGITFSISNPNMYVGQSMQVTIDSNYGYNGYNYYIQQNSNQSVVTASINNNTLTLYASISGSSTITVCQNSSYNQCGSLYVTVNGNGGGNGNGAVTFSNSNPSLTVGQSLSVNIYGGQIYNYPGGSGSYSYIITQNSNSPAVSAIIPTYNNVINLLGLAVGNSNITVCQSNYYNLGYNNNQCGTLYVTVNGNGSVLGASTYPNGTLLFENGTIYIVYLNTKTGFSNYAAFRGFGFSLANVVQVSSDTLTTPGVVISSSNTSHPWGSWILYRGTVYLVTQSGVIPVPDPNTFTNNGGQYNLIVAANTYDLSLPVLSVMSVNDSRAQ